MRRVVVVVSALALVAVGGVVASRRSTPSRRSASTEPVPQATPSASSSGPVGAQHVDVEDARVAGVRAVARTGDVVRAGMFSRADVVAQFATARYAPRLAAETTAGVNTFVVALSADGVDPSAVVVVESP